MPYPRRVPTLTRARARAAGILQNTVLGSGQVPVDPSLSTLVSSPTSITGDGVDDATVTLTLEDADDAAVVGIDPTFGATIQTVSASLSSVTVNPSSIDNDGVDSASVFVQVVDTNGNPVVGLPAANVVIAATGSGNTVTQPTGVTDANGNIAGSIVSTVSATKVLSATVLSVAVTDTASLTVASSGTPTTYASSDFSGGTISPFTNPWGDRVTVISDPTSSGRGNLVEVTYAPSSGGSMERGIKYTHSSQIRYGEEFWVKADVYQKSGTGNYDANHNRKLFDWQGNKVRMTLNRRDGILRFSAVDAMATGTEVETVAESTGITINDDTWYTIEVRMVTNSADGVRDGLIAVYVDGAASPSYTRSTNLGWITENGGATYFQNFFTGFQLTIDAGDGTYTDTRYWDNVYYSDGRL